MKKDLIPKRILKTVLCTVMATAMIAGSALTAMADVTVTPSIIDPSKKGSITIHKLHEDNGAYKEADGLDSPTDNQRDKVEGVVFKAMPIATLANHQNGAHFGSLYYQLDQAFVRLATSLGVTVESTTVGGQSPVYSGKAVQDALTQMISKPGDGTSYTGETKVIEYVNGGTVTFPATDANGNTSRNNLNLGLYLVAETGSLDDITNMAAPFLVELPMTNKSAIDGKEAQTQWQYDVTVYPKNARLDVEKYVVQDDGSLDIQSDFEIGETITQIIASEAPVLTNERTHKKYNLTDTMTAGMTFMKVNNVYLVPKTTYDNVANITDVRALNKLVLTNDYTVSPTTGTQTFTVALTTAGLSKLDAITVEHMVVVEFESVLNKDATLGSAANPNTNRPTLTWRDSNILEKHIDGNVVTNYTYRLNITKAGIPDASPVIFTMKNSTHNTDVEFVREAAGVYHLKTVGNANAVAETGTTKEISPAPNGSLVIKGLDSEEYVLKEIKTAAGYNLLGDTITITFTAPDPENGQLETAKAKFTSSNASIDLTNQAGVASMEIDNGEAVRLYTGGSGVRMYYAGAGILMAVAAAAFILGHKKDEKEA